MGLAAGEEEEEDPEREGKIYSRVRHKRSHLTDPIVLTNPTDSTEEVCKQMKPNT